MINTGPPVTVIAHMSRGTGERLWLLGWVGLDSWTGDWAGMFFCHFLLSSYSLCPKSRHVAVAFYTELAIVLGS